MAANSELDTREAAIALDIYDLIKDIKDPERTETLEELDVVKEDDVKVECMRDDELWITISFTPTVPHCSLATLIGLCLRVKLERTLDQNFKLDVRLTEGTHTIEEDGKTLTVNKQINDKERVAAAMENPDLKQIVEECVSYRTDQY